MDNERHAIDTPPKGYALAFNGELIKRSCEACIHFFDFAEYQYHEYTCDFDERLQNLKYFPFKNGCKNFELHWTFTVDWDEEARKSDAEREICQHLSHGKCFSSLPCHSAVVVENDHPKCTKVVNGVVSVMAKCIGCGQEFEDLHLQSEAPGSMPVCDGCIKTMEP